MSDKILTVFKLPNSMKVAAQTKAREQKKSFSELLTEKLDGVLKLKITPNIPKMKKGTADLVSTSVLIPDSVHKAARYKSLECSVSLADIFRYCLSK